MKLIKPILFTLVLIAFYSCKENFVDPDHTETYIIKGTVILENQNEHSNCLIYIDNFNVGYSSDSSGAYTISLTHYDVLLTDTLKLYYYLREYALDSARVVMINGKAQAGKLDLNSRGEITTKYMRQLFKVEGWTDKYEYKIGDNITFTARFTNTSNDSIMLYIPSNFNDLGHVSIYRDDCPGIIISPIDPVMSDRYIVLFSHGYYQGTVCYTLLNQATTDIIPNQYFVRTAIQILKPQQVKKKISDYIFNKWYLIHRGHTPKLDYAPNKYEFPIINIIR